VREAATRLRERHPSLHVLVNNAGVSEPTRRLSADGHELTFAVNHLAPFLLTNLLLPALDAGAPSRIVNVSSQVHAGASLDWDDLMLEHGYSGYRAYAQSKLANVLFTAELARRLDPARTTANALHPGVVGTKLLRAAGFGAGPDSLEEGAATSVRLALSPEVEGVTGEYFSRGREARSSALGERELARKLWAVSERLCGLGG
jgi:NAD(P)-dependent dehydrogenase (short-subunit alcohol dehydrogenase family)